MNANVTFYFFAMIVTELLMLAMVFHVIRYSGFSTDQKKWYLITYISIAFCVAAEFIAVRFDNYGPAFVKPLQWLTVVQFSITPLIPVFFAGALGIRRLARATSLFFLINVICEVMTVPFGWVFRFDENGKYIRSDLYIIYEASFIISLVFLIVSMFIVGKRFRHRDRSTVIMILVIMAVGLVPMLFFRIYAESLAIGLCACLCYIYYNDLVQQDARAELVANQKKLSDMQEKIITGMASLIESRDTDTGEGVPDPGSFAKALAEDARRDGVYVNVLTDRFISLLGALAPMHDIGKIVVSDEILKKPGKLTPEEFEQVKRHTTEGGAVIRDTLSGITDEEYLSFASYIATYHHERWDGKGYPEGLEGGEIPLAARITAIADVFEALITDRSWRKALPVEEAVGIIRDGAGTQFDPQLVKVFLDHIDSYLDPAPKETV